MGFHLHKWYLDCTTEAGEAVVVYAGHVRLGWLRVPYVEALAKAPDTDPERHRRLSSRFVVRSGDQGVLVDAPALGLSGTWSGAGRPIDVTLLDDPGGTIRWRCHQTGGAATVRLRSGRQMAGTGYAEELAMDIRPWALPFRELRWGRFVAPDRSLVWIDWRGGGSRRWVFWNGVRVTADSVESSGLEWPSGRLEIEPGRVLRQARIGRTLAGPLAWCLPRSIARATESKWISRGVLHEPGRAPRIAWVIHEVVRWA